MRNQFNFENESVGYNAGLVRRLQQALNRKTGANLPTDGVMGFRTRRALRGFQTRQGLPADGFLTPKTRLALGLDDSASEIYNEAEFENYEAAACPPFQPVAVENPRKRRADGRVSDKTIPEKADIVLIEAVYGKTPLRRITAEAHKALICAARADGIKHPILLPTGARSGFRDPQAQKAAWERALKRYGSAEEANKWVAKPGFSAHQSGRAIDFFLGIPNDSRNVARLRQTAAYKWMVANAHRFGFYPYKREPWHWEYNPPAAQQSEFSFETPESFELEGEFETGGALAVLSPTELKALKITSTFETGRGFSFGGLTGNFDGQGVSFGLMNFAFKAGSLLVLLQEFAKNFPARFAAIFGSDAERFKEILFATKPDPKNPKRRVRDLERQMEFVNQQMNAIPQKAKSNKIVEPWKTYFGKLEHDPDFRKIQVKAVRRAMGKARKWFDYFGFKTERGFAFMFDLVSSHGAAWLDAPKFKGRRKNMLQKMLAAKKAQVGRETLTELEKMEVIANMIADDLKPEWRKNARIRKLWFVRGIGKVHGSMWDIKKDFGITDNPPKFGNSPAKEAEFGYESYYDNEQEFEQSKQTSAPPLVKTERAASGETLYVKIPIGLWKPLDLTGIYIPDSFNPNADFELIVYLHGHKGSYPGSSVLINGYWDATRFPFFGLREEVAASGKNVIFVAPSLGAVSEAGSLVNKGGFDAYIEKVRAALNEHYFAPRHRRRIQEIPNIILAAHSGGGSPMLKIAKGGDRSAANVKECWCYDSMYGWVASAWTAWAKAHPKKKLFIYYGPAKGWTDPKTGKKRVLPRDNAEAIACEAIKSGLANVCVQPSQAKHTTFNKKRLDAHFLVPKVHLKERILQSSCSTNNVCPKRPTRRIK